MFRHFSNSSTLRFASCKRRELEQDVVSGLAITPARMQSLTRDGVPINSQANAASYDEGYRTLEYEPPAELRRGVDMAELWEQGRDIKDKMKKYYHKVRPLDTVIEAQKGGQ